MTRSLIMFCMNPCHCGLCPDTLRTDFSNILLGSMISCSQPLQRSLKSAPVRRISHSLLPQGWGFFICTISPIRYGTTSFFCFFTSVPSADFSCILPVASLPTIYICFWFLLSEAVLIALFLLYFLTHTSTVSAPRFPQYYRGKYNPPLRLSLSHHG